MKIIGIDPGTHTGIAVYDTDAKRLTALLTTDFWGAICLLRDYCAAGEDIGVVIEKPETKASFHKPARTIAAAHTIGVNVGSVLREAALLKMYLERYGIPFKTVPPQGKMKADLFQKVTGWAGPSNAHERDAGMLCFGVSHIKGA